MPRSSSSLSAPPPPSPLPLYGLAAGAPCGLAVGCRPTADCPCGRHAPSGRARSRLPPLQAGHSRLYAIATKTQQERVERFYVI
ncbi:hypothetical protein GW17_00051183 [Ensete ventricosum]|nr:hypothetical protein GW17_00051183 [Ensete ventricosum]